MTAEPYVRRPTSVGSHARVLFVDEEEVLRATFSQIAGERGFLVDTAATVSEALGLIESSTYAVVVTPLCMPEGCGISLMRSIHKKNPVTVFVVVAGLGTVEIPDEVMFRDAIASVITKPWNAEELIETLHRSMQVWESRSSRPPSALSESPVNNTILLLEDKDADASLIEAYLSLSAHDGQIVREKRLDAALELLDKNKYGIVIADLSLPDARGLDAVLRIQNVVGDTPLIVMSGVNDEAIAVQAVQAGAQDFLLKGSVDASGLIRSIRYARERKRSEHSLSQLAHFDTLTGLANRALFRQRLDHTLSRSMRTRDSFAVLFLDLDNFKPINDELGHAEGDALLTEASRRLEKVVREYDLVARLGGDEFAIVLDNLSDDPGEASSIAQRMLVSLSKPYLLGGTYARVTASIGIALYPEAGQTSSSLLKAADQAMYMAKRRGRNTCEIYKKEVEDEEGSLPGIHAELHHAIENSEFVLHYQPQYDAKHGGAIAAEGLLRWHRGGRGLVSPQEFLPALEGSNAILEVGSWVINSACRELTEWQRHGLPIRRVAVNVSPRQLDGHGLVDQVKRALTQTKIDPQCLELEITESSVMTNPDHALHVLSKIKDWGVRIAMDDFGTGHSSLSYLYKMPIDTVKIDKSFVKDLHCNAQCRSVTRAIIALAKELDLEVVAEGVEKQEQLDFLEVEGCDVLQGFLFARPMPAEDFVFDIQRSESLSSESTRVQTLLPPRAMTGVADRVMKMPNSR